MLCNKEFQKDFRQREKEKAGKVSCGINIGHRTEHKLVLGKKPSTAAEQ